MARCDGGCSYVCMFVYIVHVEARGQLQMPLFGDIHFGFGVWGFFV